MNEIQQYPWIAPLYHSLLSQQLQSKLPHALLLTGVDGLGKLAMSRLFAKVLLCQQPIPANSSSDSMLPCGGCHACQLFLAEHHPDFLFVEPEKKGGNILVDQIRQLTEFVSLTSHLGGMQVIVIDQAQRLNRNAANSLLKTLEEPTPNVILLLLSSKPNNLPATVKSRCQLRVMDVPQSKSAREWILAQDSSCSPQQADMALQLSHGAPLSARSYIAEGVLTQYDSHYQQFLALSSQSLAAVDVAAAWAKEGSEHSLQWLIYWVSTLIRIKFQLPIADTESGKHKSALQNIAAATDVLKLYTYYDKLLKTVKLLDTQVNRQLLMEALLIDWHRLQVQRR